MKTSLKLSAAAVLLAALAAPSKAQPIDWGTDPMQQIANEFKPVAAKGAAQNPRTSAPETFIHVDFRCTPAGNTPTDVIGDVRIGKNSYRQYDGGYIPLSTVHAQGYEFFVVGNTLSIRRLDRSTPSIVIGYLGAQKACTWEEVAETSVIQASLLEVATEIGPVTPCSSQIMDSRPEYSKSAELALTLNDIEFGRKAVLKSKISTVGASTQAECEQAALGD